MIFLLWGEVSTNLEESQSSICKAQAIQEERVYECFIHLNIIVSEGTKNRIDLYILLWSRCGARSPLSERPTRLLPRYIWRGGCRCIDSRPVRTLFTTHTSERGWRSCIPLFFQEDPNMMFPTDDWRHRCGRNYYILKREIIDYYMSLTINASRNEMNHRWGVIMHWKNERGLIIEIDCQCVDGWRGGFGTE